MEGESTNENMSKCEYETQVDSRSKGFGSRDAWPNDSTDDDDDML